MKPIKCHFEIVKVKENEYDVLFFSDPRVLRTFSSVYPDFFFIENSKFEKPMIAVPSFQNRAAAELWIAYWREAFSKPDQSCQTCPTVREFFRRLENELGARQAPEHPGEE